MHVYLIAFSGAHAHISVHRVATYGVRLLRTVCFFTNFLLHSDCVQYSDKFVVHVEEKT